MCAIAASTGFYIPALASGGNNTTTANYPVSAQATGNVSDIN